MITLYPTETLYALGVNALDVDALQKLYALKGRESSKAASWLVRGMDDIATYAEVPQKAAKIAEQFLPGPVTLVLRAREEVDTEVIASDGTIGFRVSADSTAQKIIAAFMEEQHAPLTCTSANLSGAPTLPTPQEILQQFGPNADMITQIHDDGPRKSLASTIVRIIDDTVTVLREGEVATQEILGHLGH